MNAIHPLAVAAFLLASAAGAQQAPQSTDHKPHHPPVAAAANSALAEGEVRRVDLAQGKVTLRHGPIANLDMPPMTMVFTAGDRKLLEGLKQGDKVRFAADKKDGTYLVTAIEVVK